MDRRSLVTSEPTVVGVRFEHHPSGFGMGVDRPRISWQTVSAPAGWRQGSYEIAVLDPDSHDVVTTAREAGPDQILVPWPGPPLQSRERRAVRVRVWDVAGANASDWSPPLPVEAGLLDDADWVAKPIGSSVDDAMADGPALQFRRDFVARHGLIRARLYITAQGVYEAEINGQTVGDEVLAPGWTSYSARLRYQTHDVTHLIATGHNAIGVTVADGWFRGHLGYRGGRRNVYGDHLTLLAQLETWYEDGSVEILTTDESWRSSKGPIRSSGLYAGETYDAREAAPGWSGAGHDQSTWSPVTVAAAAERRPGLVAPEGPPVRRVGELQPRSIEEIEPGVWIVDFGQNIAGRLRLRTSGPQGTVVTLRHAEVLEHGRLCRRPLRFADATDQFILAGTGDETYEPRFTYHGFRYAEISGVARQVLPGDVSAIVIGTDLAPTGTFHSSHDLLDAFHRNVVWSMRANFVDIPTDCPQRDERLGWLGDNAFFAPAATYLFDVCATMTSWLADVSIEQAALGTAPAYVPWLGLGDPPLAPIAGFGDGAVLIPWTLFERYGDPAILSRQYDSMRAWVDEVAAFAGPQHLWDSGFQLGDWLDPLAPADDPSKGSTDKTLIATAFHHRTARILAAAAEVLGRRSDAQRYADLADAVGAAFRARFLQGGRLHSETQTGYSLAIMFGLLSSDADLAEAGERLVGLVRARGHRIGTGFIGTPLIADALTRVGAFEDAYRLLLQTEAPSWLYAVTMGGTTVWERWDSIRPDGSVNPGQMTSFNHYSLGSISDWIHRSVVGIAPSGPGYRRVVIQPRVGGGLTEVRGALESPYGRIAVSWTHTDDRFAITVELPTGVDGSLRLPDGRAAIEIGPGLHAFDCELRSAWNPTEEHA